MTLASPGKRTRLLQQGRLILAIAGLQPDKGHEVLWVVREVLSGDVLLARSLLASGRDDRRALLRSAVADLDDLPVVGVVSDGQMALRQAVAQVFPHVPHQLCQFHDLREAGRPIWKRIGTRRKNGVNGSGGCEPLSGRSRTAVIRKPMSSAATAPPSGAPSAIAAIPRSKPGDSNSSSGCPRSPPASTGSPKKGGLASFHRVQPILRRGLEATAPLWPELTMAHGWLEEAAYLLANPDGAARATVRPGIPCC